MIPRLVISRRIRVANACGFIFHLVHSLSEKAQARPRNNLYDKLIDDRDQGHILLCRRDCNAGNDSDVINFPK